MHHNLPDGLLQKEKEYINTISCLNTDIKLLEEDYNELLAIQKQKENECILAVASCEEKQTKCKQTVASHVQRELKSNQTIDVCQQNVQSLTDTVDKQINFMKELHQEIKIVFCCFLASFCALLIVLGVKC